MFCKCGQEKMQVEVMDIIFKNRLQFLAKTQNRNQVQLENEFQQKISKISQEL